MATLAGFTSCLVQTARHRASVFSLYNFRAKYRCILSEHQNRFTEPSIKILSSSHMVFAIPCHVVWDCHRKTGVPLIRSSCSSSGNSHIPEMIIKIITNPISRISRFTFKKVDDLNASFRRNLQPFECCSVQIK